MYLYIYFSRGVFGPPLGLRYVLFIDDINASAPNKYGVYSSIELLRHYIEYKQWYNTENATPVQLVDLQVKYNPILSRINIHKVIEITFISKTFLPDDLLIDEKKRWQKLHILF